MHLYYWSRARLSSILKTFEGGQFLMKTKLTQEDRRRLMYKGASEKSTRLILMTRAERNESVVLRGGISGLEIPDMSKRIVVVHFFWLCERHLRFEDFGGLVPRWEIIPPPPKPCSQSVNVEFISYYFPKSGRRLKMWTSLGEYCRFYKLGDPDNLVQSKDGFVDPETAVMPTT